MLRHVGNIRAWYLSQLQQPRQGSFQISNLGVFDPAASTSWSGKDATGGCGSEGVQDDVWRIADVIFSQPAYMVDAVFNCNMVSL